jgi:hypothetical protein
MKEMVCGDQLLMLVREGGELFVGNDVESGPHIPSDVCPLQLERSNLFCSRLELRVKCRIWFITAPCICEMGNG